MKRTEKWELILRKVEEFTDPYLLTSEFYLAKDKLRCDRYQTITKDEYKALYKAIKVAEYNANKYGANEDAFAFRRVYFHAKEEGLDDLAYLKDKYGGCYIATAVYGSYDAKEVVKLRKFRDDFLDKKYWGQKFIEIYYRFSPKIADKMRNKYFFNGIIKFVLDNTLLKIVDFIISDKND